MSTLGNLALTAAEYADLLAVLADQAAALAAAPTLSVLCQQRQRLADNLGYAIQGAADGAAYRFDRDDMAYRATAKEQSAIETAQAAITAFDAAHPEALVEIERLRDERVAHFLAVD